TLAGSSWLARFGVAHDCDAAFDSAVHAEPDVGRAASSAALIQMPPWLGVAVGVVSGVGSGGGGGVGGGVGVGVGAGVGGGGVGVGGGATSLTVTVARPLTPLRVAITS